MKFLLDQGIPRSLVELLAAAGHEASHIGVRGLPRASDPDILQIAAREGSVIVTMDSDFHALLAIGQRNGPSVIRIRQQSLKAKEILQLLDQVLAVFSSQLESGVAVTVSETRLRARRLPIGRGKPNTET